MRNYQYWGFGLNIQSEIQFPELLPHQFATPADLIIQIGVAPKTVEGDDVVRKVGVEISPTKYLLKMPSTAYYYAANGNSIIVEPADNADGKSLRLFLLSNVMAAILHQQNKIPIHASAIEHDGGVILFCGQSGTGKSTTATMLSQNGYAIFSDDVCVLNTEKTGGEIEVYSSYPMMKLWQDSFAKVGMEMAPENDRIRPELPKYARFYHGEFDISSKPVKQIVILKNDGNTGAPKIEKLEPLKAFAALQENTYRYAQMIEMKKRNVHFTMISALTKAVPVYKISRPNLENSLDQVIDLITSTLLINDQSTTIK